MMTLNITFKSNGETVKKTAVLSDDLSTISKNRKNQATDITEYTDDDYWSVVFEENDNLQYEVEFFYGADNRKTLSQVKAITWENDIITDVQYPDVKIKR